MTDETLVIAVVAVTKNMVGDNNTDEFFGVWDAAISS